MSLRTRQELFKKMLREKGARSAPPSSSAWRGELFPEVNEFNRRYESHLAQWGRDPYFRTNEGIARGTTCIGGRELLCFSSYNYLGLSGDPRVSEAARRAIDRYGTSVSASRSVTGQRPIHQELEAELAHFLGVEDSVVFVSGHATNVTTIGHLFNARDLILYDSLIHNSVMQGCFLSGARRLAFPHNDWRRLAELLQEHRREYQKTLIVVEGVYSMDGDIAPLPEIVRLKREHDAVLMVDEAHSLGVLGRTGRGVGEHFNLARNDVDLWMGTLSKSLASCGGYIAGSRDLVRYLRYTAPGFMFSVGIPPAAAAAALEALRILEAEPWRVERLQKTGATFLSLSREANLDTGLSAGSAVVPVIMESSTKAIHLSEELFERGINVQAITYPAVEEAAARLRFFITSMHTEEQLRSTVARMLEGLAAYPGQAQSTLFAPRQRV